jgi:phosphatidate phosphatase APP1
MRKILITGTDKPLTLTGTEGSYVGNDLEQYATIVREMGLPEYIVAFLIQRVRLSETGDMI